MTDINNMTWEQAVDWLKSQPDRADLVRACYYDDPLEDAAQRFYDSAEWHAVRKLLQGRKGTALDVGAGRGISSYALARDGWAVSALEPDPSNTVGAGAIRQLGVAANLPITTVVEWGERIPFADDSFDLVYCRAVLHHARNLNDLCGEGARVLRPGGMFLATREHVISEKSDLETFLNSHPLHTLYGGEHAYLLSEYTEAIKQSGLTLIHTFNPNASDINLHPNTRARVKHNWAKRMRMPISGLIPQAALTYVGGKSRLPGRLYSFVATKG